MQISVCDLKSSNFENDFLHSIINTGFAVLVNHDIEYNIIEGLQDQWRIFFKKEDIYKKLFINGNDTNMGYKAIGSETGLYSNVPDIKEFFHWKPHELVPDSAGLFTVLLFFKLEDLGLKLLSIMEKVANSNYVLECSHSKNTILRSIYYPALKDVKNIDPNAVRASAHEDVNYITLLVASSASGLQVLDNSNEWHDVPHKENSIVVNIGDMLALSSNNLFKSTTHRVINPTNDNSDRISLPLFIHPHSSTILAHGITAGQFLNERINKIYNKTI